MAGAVAVSVRTGVQWRTMAGRFSRPPVAGSIDDNLAQLGRQGLRRLADATPIGRKAKPADSRMRARWRSTLVPTQHRLRLYNTAPYSGFVVNGTRKMRANPALQLPQIADVTASRIVADVLMGLKG
jgi:hypothetical protein